MGGVLESWSEAGVTGRRSSSHHHSALWAQRGLLQSDQEIPGAAFSQPQHRKQVQSKVICTTYWAMHDGKFSRSFAKTGIFCSIVLLLTISLIHWLIYPQTRGAKDSFGEGSGEGTTGADHWKRSQRDFPGKAHFGSKISFIYCLKISNT